MRSRLAFLLVLVVAVVPFAACGSHRKHATPPPPAESADAAAASSSAAAPPPPPSLYERLGKRDAIAGVVAELIGSLAADKRVNRAFSKVAKDKDRSARLQASLVEELCVVTGGDDCNYQGKPMKDAHQGMNVTEAQWAAFMGDLNDVLKLHDVDPALVKELDDKLEAATKADIVVGGSKEKGK
jgi:hemoglobin